MQTVFGYFENFDDARAAVAELQARGFHNEQMNIIAQQDIVKSSIKGNRKRVKANQPEKVGSITVAGIESLLGNLQPMKTNDLGKIYAVGELAPVMVKTDISTEENSEGIKQAMIDFGLSSETADAYERALKEGYLLLFLRVPDERAGDAAEILREKKAARVASYA